MNDIQIFDIPWQESLYFPEEAGAIVEFKGIVRNHNLNKSVIALEYEAYIPMAISEMQRIQEKACEIWTINTLYMYHRVGKLYVGDTAVWIAVATVHRKEAFEACEYLIDSLKQKVPIWKKEIYEDQSEWLTPTP